MSDINMECKEDAALLANVFLYQRNVDLFGEKVKAFDIGALRAYIALATYHQQQQQHQLQYDGTPTNLTKLLDPCTFFTQLNDVHRKSSIAENRVCKYLVDAFEVMISLGRCLDDSNAVTFYTDYHSFLEMALQMEQADIVSVYFQVLHRLDHAFDTQIPVAILKTIIEAVHGPLSGNSKLLNEALLLIESNIQKRHKSAAALMGASAEVLTFIWRNLCPRRSPIHQCNVCYTIIAQLIQVYVDECRLNAKFAADFLSNKLWHFVRDAIESKELLRRKQANYILQHVLESNQRAVMMTASTMANGGSSGSRSGSSNSSTDGGDSDIDLVQIWKNFFAILESLLEIQCQLVISCLDQYLDGIVKHLPPFWYSILLVLVLKHHNNIVIHYGITFILRHHISLEHDDALMDSFYGALNNTYLHSEAKIDEQQLADYFARSDMNRTLKIMKFVDWHAVPLWVVFKSIEIYVHAKQSQGFQMPLLLEFLKRSMSTLKQLPQTDQMAVNILRGIGVGQLNLQQALVLFHLIGRREILDEFKQPLDVNSFEMLLQMDQISLDTKIQYFEHVVPNAEEQSKFLAEFYDNHRAIATRYPHYEFLLMNAIYTEKQFYAALLITAPSIYGLMRPNGSHYTLDGLNFSATLLKFIVVKFLGNDTEYTSFDGINRIVSNIIEILRQEQYAGRKDPRKVEEIKDHVTVINMKMTKCTKLYHIKMAVLGPLTNAMMLEEDSIDLSRFDPHDEDDVSAVQGLYEWFEDKSQDFKQSHKANVLFKILTRFHQLDLDIFSAYRTLLSEERDISCIFQQTHPTSVAKMNEILADALIYGLELKGEEKQAYDFVSSKSSSMTYNQKVRLTAMRAIAAKNDTQQIATLKDLLFVKNKEMYRIRYYTNSYHHSLKLRITQALAFLFRLDGKWDDRMLKILLEEANQTNVTHINELILAATIEPEQMLQIIAKTEGNKGLQSLFVVIYYVCSKQPKNVDYARRCIEFLIKYVFVKQIVVRTSAQIVMVKLCEKFCLIHEFEKLYHSTKMAHELKISRALKFSYAYKYRYEQIDATKLLHTMYTLREIPRITKMHSDEYYEHEIFDDADESLTIQMDEDELASQHEGIEVELGFIDNAEDTIMNAIGGGANSGNGNVQRKLVTYRETFIDRELLNSLSDEFRRYNTKCEGDLIVMATLLTKPANLGGLTRSSEVFGVKAVALDNLKHLKQNDFTSISMAAEKWVKFFEVKHYNVINYLMAMKANGYTIVGAEQTAFGQELHRAELPKKMVLVLGHEKSGIPADILNMLDMAIEIPQFGVVRSLNVTTTASIFMWEYCKQHQLTTTSDGCHHASNDSGLMNLSGS